MTRQRARRLVVLILVCSSVSSPAVVLAQPTAAEQLASSHASISPSDEAARAEALAATSEDAGALGVYFDKSTSEYVVVFPASIKGNVSLLRDSTSLPVRVENREIERSDIERIEKALFEGKTFATKDPYWFAFDARTGKVAIHASGPAADFAPILEPNGSLVSIEPADMKRLSRTNDAPPHRGGAYIIGNIVGKPCTSGFGVHKNTGSNNIVTAGHCGVNNEHMTGGTGLFWGTVWNRLSYPLYDLELIAAGAQGKIYTGDTTGTSASVKGAANPSVGSTSYCWSGIMVGETCGHHVTSLSGTFCDDSGDCTPNVIQFEDGTEPNDEGGDSGAPFYNYPAGGGVTIRGLLFGYDFTAHVGFAEKWTTIRDAFAVTILTS